MSRLKPHFYAPAVNLILKWVIIIKMAIGRKKKALVHIAKGDLHLDEESYRQYSKVWQG